MNFSKYTAALALFATAAYAAADNKAPTETNPAATTTAVEASNNEPKTVVITSAKLRTAFDKCNTEENKDGDKMKKCLESENVPEGVITKLKLKDVKELKDDAAAQKIIDEVNDELNGEKHWYDSINNVYGYIGGAVLLAAIGGGIYMAVGRKSEEADL